VEADRTQGDPQAFGDLGRFEASAQQVGDAGLCRREVERGGQRLGRRAGRVGQAAEGEQGAGVAQPLGRAGERDRAGQQIGRASCRERV